MSKMVYLMALPILSGLVAFASAGPAADPGNSVESAQAHAVRCDIRVSNAPGGIELEAVASADRHAAGVYRLRIEKSGPGGSSSVSQGGDFTLTRGAEAVLGTAGLGLERRASYTAHLSLESVQGKTLCEAERSK